MTRRSRRIGARPSRGDSASPPCSVAAEYAAEAGRWDEASESLRKLIAETADLDRANATRALESVTLRRAEADARARADREAAEGAQPAGPHEATQATGTAATAQPIDRPSRLADTVALSLVGVGLVGVGLGAGFWWHGNKLAEDSDNARATGS